MTVGVLNDKGSKARYGVAYLRAICSQAGVPLSETSPDEDVLAIDCEAKFEEASVLVQVKCTSALKLNGPSSSVKLEPAWKEKWSKSMLPVYLLLVIVPPQLPSWVTHSDTGTLHASGAFWVRVYGTEGTTVDVPKSQRLKADTFEQWHKDLLACFEPAA